MPAAWLPAAEATGVQLRDWQQDRGADGHDARGRPVKPREILRRCPGVAVTMYFFLQSLCYLVY